MQDYHNLSHTKWGCKCHVVFIPKRRKKAIFGGDTQALGRDFARVSEAEGVQDPGGAFDERPRSYLYQHSDEVLGSERSGLHQGDVKSAFRQSPVLPL